MGLQRVFVSDMDGVLLDSVDMLYRVYTEFLAHHGIDVGHNEFAQISGKNVAETITFIKQQHGLSQDFQDLYRTYDKQMKVGYAGVRLNAGVGDALGAIHDAGFRTALASSSRRSNVDYVLGKFQIAQYFEVIVAGDDVTSAKPNPEIYHRVKTKLGDGKYYVLEDSRHGIQAALSANMSVIHYNRTGVPTDLDILFSVRTMDELARSLHKLG